MDKIGKFKGFKIEIFYKWQTELDVINKSLNYSLYFPNSMFSIFMWIVKMAQQNVNLKLTKQKIVSKVIIVCRISEFR